MVLGVLRHGTLVTYLYCTYDMVDDAWCGRQEYIFCVCVEGGGGCVFANYVNIIRRISLHMG